MAERMRAVYITPDGRSRTVTAQTSLDEFPEGEVDTAVTIDLMTERIYTVCRTMREVHDDVDDADPTTADILHSILERAEQLGWMVSAENRVANTTSPKPIHE